MKTGSEGEGSLKPGVVKTVSVETWSESLRVPETAYVPDVVETVLLKPGTSSRRIILQSNRLCNDE